MARRQRIRKMMLHGSGAAASDTDDKPPEPPKQTNAQILTGDLSKKIADQAKKPRKPKYIDTSKLLTFRRQ